jgi:MFS family permease
MQHAQPTLSAKVAFLALSAMMFFLSAQVSLTIYIDSSYLSQTLAHMTGFLGAHSPERFVGILYTVASLITLLALVFAPKILRALGNYRATLVLLIAHTILLLGLALFDHALMIVPMFVFESALVSLLYFNFDVFLERYSKDKDTGRIRGLFLVIGSIAWFLPPFFAGHIVEMYGFSQVYLLAGILIIPSILIIMKYFKQFEDMTYVDVPFFFTQDRSPAHHHIQNILTLNFFMHTFYAIMIIYAPLFIKSAAGLSHEQFGLMLSVALTAFIVFPYFAGVLADKYIGEKELLVGGFALMAISTAMLAYIISNSALFLVIGMLLFIGRAGASVVESMTESYFFKHIDGRNAGLIGYFRRSRPLAFIVAPALASLLLSFELISMQGLFYLLGALMATASVYALTLKDTR